MWQIYLIVGVVIAAAIGVMLLGLFVGAQRGQFWADIVQIAVGHFMPKVAAQVARDFANPELAARNRRNARFPAGGNHPGTGVTTGKTITQAAATARAAVTSGAYRSARGHPPGKFPKRDR